MFYPSRSNYYYARALLLGHTLAMLGMRLRWELAHNNHPDLKDCKIHSDVSLGTNNCKLRVYIIVVCFEPLILFCGNVSTDRKQWVASMT